MDNFKKVTDYIELLISIDTDNAMRKIWGGSGKPTIVEVDQNSIVNYLKKRGYSIAVNTSTGLPIYIKGFTCVAVHAHNTITIWHDVPNSKKRVVNEGLISQFPSLLDYMEKI